MFTLSDASKDTRQFIKWTVIFLAFIFFSFVFIKIALIIKDIILPPAPQKATSLFGQLPSQTFPANATDSKLTYSVNTVSGYLPVFQTIANVYKTEIIRPELNTIKKFEEQIRSIGYTRGYNAISNNIFEWKINPARSDKISSVIRLNTTTNNFIISSDYLSNPDYKSSTNIPSVSAAIKMATNILQATNRLTKDLDNEKTKTNLYSIENGTLIKATSISKTQIIEVNFYQKDIDKLPIYYEKPNSSNISILTGGGKIYNGQVVSASYRHQNISTEKSTYDIKTTTQAFEDLRNGKGYIATYEGTSDNIAINNAFLAYYFSSQTQDFLMPIFVFTGNDNFYAYVPAVTDGWISK